MSGSEPTAAMLRGQLEVARVREAFRDKYADDIINKIIKLLDERLPKPAGVDHAS